MKASLWQKLTLGILGICLSESKEWLQVDSTSKWWKKLVFLNGIDLKRLTKYTGRIYKEGGDDSGTFSQYSSSSWIVVVPFIPYLISHSGPIFLPSVRWPARASIFSLNGAFCSRVKLLMLRGKKELSTKTARGWPRAQARARHAWKEK